MLIVREEVMDGANNWWDIKEFIWGELLIPAGLLNVNDSLRRN